MQASDEPAAGDASGLQAPDITPYRAGNTGVDYITTFDAGDAGPHVMLSALVHGNEVCGASALDFLLQRGVRPRRGKLTFAFMNTAAYERFDPAHPTRSRFVDQDFNRVWSPGVLDGPGDSVELRRARAVRPFLDQVDYLLDLHSMQQRNVPLALCGRCRKGERLARAVGFPAHIVRDGGHEAGTRMRDYGAFAAEASPKNALLVECGQHGAPSSAEVAKQAALYFLAGLGSIERDDAEALLTLRPARTKRVIEVTDPVTVRHGDFTFARAFRGMEVIREAGTVIALDGGREIRTPYDHCILIMPSRRLEVGSTAVRLGRLVESIEISSTLCE